jgi:uncharacterized MAPEG superfamily protein
MTIAEILILVAGLLPYAVVAYAKQRSKATFNNADPRNHKSYTGAAERANGAHLNGFETFPLFAIAVILSELHGMPQGLVNNLALLYVLLRITYSVLYIQNRATARSAVWSLGFLVTIILFLLPIILGLTHVSR